MLISSRVQLSFLALVFLILLSLSCGGKTQEIRQKAAEQLGTAAEKLGVEITPTLATQTPTRPTPKAEVPMKGTAPKPAASSGNEFVLKEGEARAVEESFYLQESAKPKRSVKLKQQAIRTLKDPPDARHLAIGKGLNPIIPDLPDPDPGTEKPSWIDRGKGNSKKFPTLLPMPPKGTSSESPPSGGVTIQGRLFYNDLRLSGRFDERRDLDGNQGVGISSLNADIDKECYEAKSSDCGLLDEENFLAARMVVATFWEVDREYERRDRRDCEDFQYLGRSTVGEYGNYSLVLQNIDDDCPDGDPAAEIVVRFILRFCNSSRYCFELNRKNEEGEERYRKYHRDAKPWNPLIVTPGSTHALVDEKFGGDLADAVGKEWAIAANHYATLVDTMHVVHDEAGIPFRFDKYGGLVVLMCPAAYKARLSDIKKEKECFNGRTFGKGEIGISEPFWPKGPVLAHEYGHILDNRTGYNVDCRALDITDCHYGRKDPDKMEDGITKAEGPWDGIRNLVNYREYYKDTPPIGILNTTKDDDEPKEWEEGWLRTSWSATSYEYPYVALQEGWANFVSRAVMETCYVLEENTGSAEVHPNYSPTEHTANGYARNVTKLLCDWYDEHRAQDDDAEMIDDDGVDRFPGYGDRFEASLWSIWYNLDKSPPGKKGKAICDYARYYIEERKGSAKVGQAVHDYYKDRIVNLIYNNGLKCGYKAPESKTAFDLSGAIKTAMVCSAGPHGRKECD